MARGGTAAVARGVIGAPAAFLRKPSLRSSLPPRYACGPLPFTRPWAATGPGGNTSPLLPSPHGDAHSAAVPAYRRLSLKKRWHLTSYPAVICVKPIRKFTTALLRKYLLPSTMSASKFPTMMGGTRGSRARTVPPAARKRGDRSGNAASRWGAHTRDVRDRLPRATHTHQTR